VFVHVKAFQDSLIFLGKPVVEHIAD